MVLVGNAGVFVQFLAFPKCSNYGVIFGQAGILPQLMEVFEHRAIQCPNKIGATIVFLFVTLKLFSFSFRQRLQHLMCCPHFHQSSLVEKVQAVSQLNDRADDIRKVYSRLRNFPTNLRIARKL